jgi:hypothetical protein
MSGHIQGAFNKLDTAITILSKPRNRYVAGVPASLGLAYSILVTSLTIILLTVQVIFMDDGSAE